MGFYDFTIQTITLSDGTTYTPKKGERPERPCRGCTLMDDCLKSSGICNGYLDYEHKLAVWNVAVFD